MAGIQDPSPEQQRLIRLLSRPALEAAPRLLGAVVRHESAEGAVAVRLSEVEAYQGVDDPGSHAYRGRTPRTNVMFGPAGHLYVYFSYGMHWCVNVVTGPDGRAGAVLLRAGEVVEGLDLARSRRPAARIDRDLARGPARLASALGVDKALDGSSVSGPPMSLALARRPVRAASIRTGPRVGVSGAGGDAAAFPWRFWVDADVTVSAYRPAERARTR